MAADASNNDAWNAWIRRDSASASHDVGQGAARLMRRGAMRSDGAGARNDAVQGVAAGAPNENEISWGENEQVQQVSNPIAAPSSQQTLGTTAARHAEI